MFNLFFNKKSKNIDRLSKDAYWKKWELFDYLHKGEKLLLNLTNNKHAESQLLQFKDEFIEELYEIEGDNVADFTRIWEWFTPKNKWEKLLGDKGIEIGKNVFRITDKWKRNQCFCLGTKVSLENEYGVVLDKIEGCNEYGQIRWDTQNENDIEDWQGIFGSFLQAGGKIISQNHEFKFINNDGSIKSN